MFNAIILLISVVVVAIIISVINNQITISSKFVREKRMAEEENKRETEEAARKQKQAEEEAARKQREAYAIDFHNKANWVALSCSNNISDSNQIIPSPAYKSIGLQELMWNVLNNISLNMQKLEITVEELNAKELNK